MKKIAVVLMIVMVLSVFAGCSGTGSDGNTNTVAEQANKSVGEICAEMIPDPNEFFKKATIDTAVGEVGCIYDISGAITKDEYLSYVEACKKAGFTRIKLETSDDDMCGYYALDESGKYRVTVDYSEYDGDTDVYITGAEYVEETDANEQ